MLEKIIGITKKNVGWLDALIVNSALALLQKLNGNEYMAMNWKMRYGRAEKFSSDLCPSYTHKRCAILWGHFMSKRLNIPGLIRVMIESELLYNGKNWHLRFIAVYDDDYAPKTFRFKPDSNIRDLLWQIENMKK